VQAGASPSSQSNDGQAGYAFEMGVTFRTQKDAVTEVNRGGSNRQIVRRNHVPGSGRFRKQVGPSFCHGAIELDYRNACDKSLDPSPSGSRTCARTGQAHTNLQFGVDNRRNNRFLSCEGGKASLQACPLSFYFDEGAGIDD